MSAKAQQPNDRLRESQVSATILILNVLGAFANQSDLAPVPPPQEQTTADCAHPVYASDQLVCADPSLRQLDQQLADRLRTTSLDDALLLEGDVLWFRRRSRCAFQTDHRQCLLTAYNERLGLLSALDPQSGVSDFGQPIPVDCAAPGQRLRATIAFSTDKTRMVLRNPQTGAALGAAWQSKPTAGWTSYAGFERSRNRVRISVQPNASWRCTIQPG
ncbi:hypothetical protein [Novosphingobium sp. FKTRR1]|uniref:hypothetical protein n=1 Tax=Novosphingobium sp. FKTRR1 TaxID=2879118 RepID=UPI001CF05AE3|nr:hypothetical protein [Novosphingobium sp. FKTRR1]